jgi:2-C-methyl-D-erythritol 4-phosphate cytidylyltransferase
VSSAAQTAHPANVAVIVLAAGSGTRFGGAKQFALLAGERLVDRAIRMVTAVAGPPILALPADVEWDGPPVRAVVAGGQTRTESVRNALAATPADATVIIVHDVARPLATAEQIQALVDAIQDGADAAVLTWALPDTVKELRPDGTLEHRGRDRLLVAQTPMGFSAPMLRKVFATYDEIPIEESIVVEELGGRVVAVAGDRWSHHVVEPRDLELFERLLAEQSRVVDQ